MKEKRLSKTMRWTAGVIYGALALFDILAMRYVLANAATSQMTVAWVLELMVLLGAGVMAVFLLGGEAVLKPGTRRAVVVATVLVVCFELLTYKIQTGAILYSLSEFMPSVIQDGGTLYLLIAMIVKLLLMILAAFFVQSASTEMDLMKATNGLEVATEEAEKAADTLEKAVENGLDKKIAETVQEEIEGAKQVITEATGEMDTALKEATGEDGAKVIVVEKDDKK